MTRIGKLVLATLLAVATVACGDGAAPQRATIDDAPAGSPSGVGPGDLAPIFTATELDGGSISLADLRGRPVIVNFWLTTCEPCVREMPLLAAAASQHEDLVLLAVNPEESGPVIERFLAELGVGDQIRVVLDPDAVITRAYLAPAYPTTFFIDRAGVVRYRRFGEVKLEHLQVGLERTL